MEATRFDALTRAIPDISRLSALSEMTAAGKKKKISKKKLFKRCKKQVAPCGAFLRVSCGDDPVCDISIACCNALATCDTSGFLFCLLAGG